MQPPTNAVKAAEDSRTPGPCGKVSRESRRAERVECGCLCRFRCFRAPSTLRSLASCHSSARQMGVQSRVKYFRWQYVGYESVRFHLGAQVCLPPAGQANANQEARFPRAIICPTSG